MKIDQSIRRGNMDKQKILKIKEKYDQNLDELMMHVEAIRNITSDFNAVEFIRELSTEILYTSDEYTEDLEEQFGLSLFSKSESCDVCWLVEATKDHAIKFITELDKFIEKKLLEQEDSENISDEDLNLDEDTFSFKE